MRDDLLPRLLRALKLASELLQILGDLDGTLGDFGDHAVWETRNELSGMIRRLRNLALMEGASPAAVEKVGRMAA